MDTPSNDKNAWLSKITLAALTGVISAAARALTTWALHH
jgi:hypothetical protein